MKPKTSVKRLVVCIDNDGYAVSLEKRKIYMKLRDADAEKRGLLRVVDEFGRRLSLSEGVLSRDRSTAGGQEGRLGGCMTQPVMVGLYIMSGYRGSERAVGKVEKRRAPVLV